jgi:hypothetical protein
MHLPKQDSQKWPSRFCEKLCENNKIRTGIREVTNECLLRSFPVQPKTAHASYNRRPIGAIGEKFVAGRRFLA